MFRKLDEFASDATQCVRNIAQGARLAFWAPWIILRFGVRISGERHPVQN